MRVAIPHQLGKDEVRRRLQSRSHEIADHIPGGMAEITTSWPNPDRMSMAISAMGKQMAGTMDLEDEQIVLNIDLPPALSFIQPMVESAIRSQGQKLLAPPKD